MKYRSVAELDDALMSTSAPVIEAVRSFRGPVMILGAGGKMGPTLAGLAKRSLEAAGRSDPVIAVSRFREPDSQRWFHEHGIRTLAADLFDPKAVAALPDTETVFYLVGLKFGTAQNPSVTWAANTLIPASIANRFPRSRIVALSTGNVYPLVDALGPGADETHALTPLGEYPNAAVARERLFEWHSRQNATPMVLVRLNYAVDLRYGVLHDIARRIWDGEPVPLATGRFNCIWQGDANAMILRLAQHAASPPLTVNLTGSEALSVRDVAEALGRLLNREPRFEGTESATALLSDTRRCRELLGPPRVTSQAMIEAVADWVSNGGPSLDKPTHFEVRDGVY
ncbi:MAG: NAD(P)-dependent oxidoreductase [Verrucomicrobiales bacterium]|nr:NAD(P)-dependent oxidoreductase [Verrucomicrobiales bacterium]